MSLQQKKRFDFVSPQVLQGMTFVFNDKKEVLADFTLSPFYFGFTLSVGVTLVIFSHRMCEMELTKTQSVTGGRT